MYKDKLQNCSCNQFHYIGTYKQVETNSLTTNRGENNDSEKDRKNTAATASKSEMKPAGREVLKMNLSFLEHRRLLAGKNSPYGS
jgi:hypothetical protein